MTSPCGKIRIPINESDDDKSQIEQYLDVGLGRISVGGAVPGPAGKGLRLPR